MMRVLVLYSDVAPDAPPEEQDTLIAAEAVEAALTRRGHVASRAPYAGEGLRALLAAAAPDVVFNLVEGIDGLGRLAPEAPRALAALGARFTGVRAEAMDLTNDKPRTKALLRQAGLATPDWCEGPDWAGLGASPVIVKAAMEDASLGLDEGCVVTGRAAAIARAQDCAARLGGDWFAEAFIEGREFNLSVLGAAGEPRVLPMAEMCFVDWPAGKPRIVGYDAKWQEDSTGWRGTVRRFGVEREEPLLAARLGQACERIWDIFALSGFVRVDFRVDADGTPLVLEINANPCISPDAGFAAAAQEAGLAYDDLILALVQAA